MLKLCTLKLYTMLEDYPPQPHSSSIATYRVFDTPIAPRKRMELLLSGSQEHGIVEGWREVIVFDRKDHEHRVGD
jgi:hypothetical protein